MAQKSYASLADILNRESILIRNSLNDEIISTRMARFGYPAEKIREGLALLTGAENLYLQQKEEYAEYYEAADAFSTAKELFHDIYLRDVKFARVAFNDQPSVLNSINASGRRGPSYSIYMERARTFYSSFIQNEDLLNAMMPFGYTLEHFQGQLDTLNGFDELLHAREREQGDAQQATKDRDKKFDELSDWCSIYRQVTALAFEDQPQYLEKLGTIVKS